MSSFTEPVEAPEVKAELEAVVSNLADVDISSGSFAEIAQESVTFKSSELR